MGNNEFDILVNSFITLSTKDKVKEIINTLKEDIAIFDGINKINNFNEEIIYNREIIDVNKDNPTIDDYYEAIFVYLKMLEDISGKVLNHLCDNTI